MKILGHILLGTLKGLQYLLWALIAYVAISTVHDAITKKR